MANPSFKEYLRKKYGKPSGLGPVVPLGLGGSGEYRDEPQSAMARTVDDPDQFYRPEVPSEATTETDAKPKSRFKDPQEKLSQGDQLSKDERRRRVAKTLMTLFGHGVAGVGDVLTGNVGQAAKSFAPAWESLKTLDEREVTSPLSQEAAKKWGFEPDKFSYEEMTKLGGGAKAGDPSRDPYFRVFDNEQQLRKEWAAQPEVAGTRLVSGTIRKIESLITNDDSGVSDQALITAFAKLNDPTSAVLTGEAEAVSKTAAAVDWFGKMVGQIQKGTKLSAPQRKQIASSALNIYKGYLDAKKSTDNTYRRLATAHGFNPGNVVIDTGSVTGKQTEEMKEEFKGIDDDRGEISTPSTMSDEDKKRLEYLRNKKASQGK